MRGYISPVDGDRQVTVESRVELYRTADAHRVVADHGTREVSLGVADVTVSRKKDGTAPVVIEARSEFVEVRNQGNKNGITVISEVDETSTDVEVGCVERVKRDAAIEVGYQTRLRLVVERERKNVIKNQGDGDVVMGDQTNVDQSTRVEDAVMKDSNVGSEAVPGDDPSGGRNVDAKTTVEDAVVSDSSIGAGSSSGSSPGTDSGTNEDTRKVCETHGITYQGDPCPLCAQERGSPDGEDTKYCLYCGDEIAGRVLRCPGCGEELPA
jgi:hypothetical protein